MAGTLHRYGPAPHQLAFVSSSTRPPRSSSPDADADDDDAAAAAPTAAAAPAAPPPPRPRLHVVLLSGLTEGLLALPYAPLLAERCASLSLELVQAQLRSSYDGWGRAGLDGDAAEVAALVAWLGRERRSRGVVLVGHSTGCQIACRVCERLGREECDRPPERGEPGGSEDAAAAPMTRTTTTETTTTTTPTPTPTAAAPPSPLLGVVLQAPVSDREYFLAAWPPEVAARRLADARAAVAEGDPERVVAQVDGSAACARRLLALLARRGDDDMFSRDLTPAELREGTSVGWLCGQRALGGDGARRPALVLASGADEYALPLLPAPPPEGEQGASPADAAAAAAARAEEKLGLIRAAAERVAEAAGPGATAVTLAGAPHNGAGKEKEVVAAIEGLLRRVLCSLSPAATEAEAAATAEAAAKA